MNIYENLNIPIKRCSCCIMPNILPHIDFDNNGICKSCRTFKSLNNLEDISKNFDNKSPDVMKRKKYS